MWRETIIVVTLLVAVSGAVSGALEWDENEVHLRILDDKSFEHDTQAATGQTTGHWLVLFTSSDCPRCASIEANLVSVLSQMNEGLPIMAKIDISVSPKTARRFNAHEVPQLILFRDRHMYIYAGQWSSDSIVRFIQDGWRNLPAKDVPKEMIFGQEIQEHLWVLYKAAIEYLGNRPGILAGVGSITAMGGYAFTKQWLIKKHKKRKVQAQKRSD